jgi:hypothetical protein
VLEIRGIWPIANRPQATSLPYNACDHEDQVQISFKGQGYSADGLAD